MEEAQALEKAWKGQAGEAIRKIWVALYEQAGAVLETEGDTVKVFRAQGYREGLRHFWNESLKLPGAVYGRFEEMEEDDG